MADNGLYSEKELLLRVAEGDEKAFRGLFDDHRERIYAFGLYMTHSHVIAEDLVQEVFMRVWSSRQKLTRVTHFRAYLKTIARNAAFDHLRLLAAEKLLPDAPASIPETGEQITIARQYEQMYREAIQTLSPARKRAYLLSRQSGMKNEEIAAEMGISLYTVKEHLKLAARKIRTEMERKTGLMILIAAFGFFN